MKRVMTWSMILLLSCACEQGNGQIPDNRPSNDIHATNTQDIVDNFVRTLGAIEEKFPELHGFSQATSKRTNQSEVVFNPGAKPGKGKDSRLGEHGIELYFAVFPDNVPSQLSAERYSSVLMNLHAIVYGSFRLSDKPSEGLHDTLDRILREHVIMLEEFNKKAAKPLASDEI